MKLFDASHNYIRIFKTSVDFENLLLSNNSLIMDDYFFIRNVYGTLDLSYNHIIEFNWKIINCVKDIKIAFNRISNFNVECPTKRYLNVKRLNIDDNYLCNFDLSSNLGECLPNLKFLSLLNNRLNIAAKNKTKQELTKLCVKSQVYDYDCFSQSDEDENKFISIFDWFWEINVKINKLSSKT